MVYSSPIANLSVRQHVNPLSRFFQLPIDFPRLEELFDNPDLPIHLDIGSARGKFLLNMASFQSDWNYVGVEIRKPLVVAAEKEREQLDLKNLRFVFCNANVSLESWLFSLPRNRLRSVSIQFPDPWFKRRHHKRRVLQPSLLLAMSEALQPNFKLFIQSDIFAVIEHMNLLIELSDCFNRFQTSKGLWLDENPFCIPTEREDYVISKDLPIYRALYTRNNQPVPDLTSFQIKYNSLT